MRQEAAQALDHRRAAGVVRRRGEARELDGAADAVTGVEGRRHEALALEGDRARQAEGAGRKGGVVAALGVEGHAVAESGRERLRPGAGRDHDRVGGERFAVREKDAQPLAADVERGRARIDECGAALAGEAREVRDEESRVGDVASVRIVRRDGGGRSQRRLEGGKVGAAENLQWNAESALAFERRQGGLEVRRAAEHGEGAALAQMMLEPERVEPPPPGGEGGGMDRAQRDEAALDLRRARRREEAREPRQEARQIGRPDRQRPERVGEPARQVAPHLRRSQRQDVVVRDPARISVAGAALKADGIDDGDGAAAVEERVRARKADDAAAEDGDRHPASAVHDRKSRARRDRGRR